MRILLIMDPVERVIPARDSSLALLLAARAAGHEVHHCLAADVAYADGGIDVSSRPAHAVDDHAHGMVLGEVRRRPIGWFDAALIRCDPPFDRDYLALTLLLEHARDDLVIVNDPRGLREANEHLYALRFPALVPSTIVTADRRRIVAFAAGHGGAVVKPVDGHAGQGVLRIVPDDPNTSSLLDSLTAFGTRCVVAQRFLPEVRAGDKRIFLLDGRAIGAILRVPDPNDFRASIARGEVLPAELTAADRRVIDAIGPTLRRDGLWFVGIDVIDGWLSEVNVTSPTGLVQLAALTGGDPASTVIAALEAQVRHRLLATSPRLPGPAPTTRKARP